MLGVGLHGRLAGVTCPPTAAGPDGIRPPASHAGHLPRYKRFALPVRGRRRAGSSRNVAGDRGTEGKPLDLSGGGLEPLPRMAIVAIAAVTAPLPL